MKKPLISIIIPMHNTGNSCLKLIKILQKSTYKNIEIICIDDGSTDNSFNVVKRYITGKKNIVLKKQKNSGASAARNAGINIANGEWISFIDSDDIVDKEFIEELFAAYNDSVILANVALFYNRIATGEGYPEFMKKMRSRKKHESIKEYVAYSMLHDGRLYGVINKLFRRDIINENNICFDTALNFAEDTKFVLDYIDAAIRYYPKNATLKSIYEPLYTYNFGTNTSIVSKSSLDWKNWKKSYKNLNAWASNCRTFRMKMRKILIWCRWRISHAFAVARSEMPSAKKRKYLNIVELFFAGALLKIRK